MTTEHTQIFNEFGDCLEVAFHDLTIYDEDFYKKIELYKSRLSDIKIELNFKWTLEDDKLEAYVKRKEGRVNVNKAKEEISSIVDKLQKINKHLEKLIPKRQFRDMKHREDEIKRQRKMEQDRNKLQLLEEKNRVKEEKKIQKERERIELVKWNSEIIECETCGEQHARNYTLNHLASNTHKIRIESITWYRNRIANSTEGETNPNEDL